MQSTLNALRIIRNVVADDHRVRCLLARAFNMASAEALDALDAAVLLAANEPTS